jgi:hypothetical protein
MGDCEVFWNPPGHVLARWNRVLVQIRTGAMTLDIATQIQTSGKLARFRIPPPQRIGFLAVVAANAPLAERDAIPVQRENLARLSADERIHSAVVSEGSGPGAMIKRAFLRPMLRGPRIEMFATVGPAVAWLLKAIDEPDVRGLLDYVAALRSAL